MKRMVFVGATALLIATNTVDAQSLEENYATLCSESSSKQNETCTALRKAMLQKLSAEDGSQPPSNYSSGTHLKPNAQVLSLSPDQRPNPSLVGAMSPRSDLMASLASSETPLDPRWGVLARLVNTHWASENISDQSLPQPLKVYRSYLAVTFLDGGHAVEIESDIDLNSGSPARIFTLRPTSAPGVFNGEIKQPAINGKWNVKFRTDQQGSVVSDWYKVTDGLGDGSPAIYGRTGLRVMPNGSLAVIAAMGRGNNRPALTTPDDSSKNAHLLKPYDEAAMQIMVAEQVASYQEWLETYHADNLALQRELRQMVENSNARRAQQERERLARKKSGGGLFGTLLGAAVGIYAGKIAGLDTERTLGAMLKGVSFAHPNGSLGNTLGSTGDQILGAGNPSSAFGGYGATGVGGGRAVELPSKPGPQVSADLVGFGGIDCAAALRNAGPRFTELPGNREITQSGWCIVRGHIGPATITGGNSSQ